MAQSAKIGAYLIGAGSEAARMGSCLKLRKCIPVVSPQLPEGDLRAVKVDTGETCWLRASKPSPVSRISPEILQVVAANPDVVLCDSLSSALSGDDLLLDLRRNLPNAKILLFGMDCDPEKFLIAVERGVTGYVLKDASASEVANAIRSAGTSHLPFHIVPSALRSCRKLRFLAARHSGTAESWPHSPRATTGAVSKRGSDQ